MTGPHRHAVLVDANVLYSRTLRDWLALFYLSDTEIFHVYYSTDILAEVLYHLRKNHPGWHGQQITAARRHIEDTFAEGLVDDFSADVPFSGSDPADLHVHAAALACGADILLTANADDFVARGAGADSLPYEVWGADDFFVVIDDTAPYMVKDVVRAQFCYWVERDSDVDLAARLVAASAPNFALRVAAHLRSMNFTLE